MHTDPSVLMVATRAFSAFRAGDACSVTNASTGLSSRVTHVQIVSVGPYCRQVPRCRSISELILQSIPPHGAESERMVRPTCTFTLCPLVIQTVGTRSPLSLFREKCNPCCLYTASSLNRDATIPPPQCAAATRHRDCGDWVKNYRISHAGSGHVASGDCFAAIGQGEFKGTVRKERSSRGRSR